MSETWKIDRKQGDPLEVTIDFKHALWSADEGYWAEYAPDTLKHLKAGIDGGELAESGDTFIIHTAPKKEIRFGKVTIDSKRGAVWVEFRQEWDEGEAVTSNHSFLLPKTTAELLAEVDTVESRLIEWGKELR